MEKTFRTDRNLKNNIKNIGFGMNYHLTTHVTKRANVGITNFLAWNRNIETKMKF